MSDINFIYAFAVVMAFSSLLILAGLPEELQIIDTFDMTWLSGGIIGIATACAIGASVPVFGGLICGGAVTVWGILGIWEYVIVSDEYIKLIVFTPIVIGLIYIISSKIVRGN